MSLSAFIILYPLHYKSDLWTQIITRNFVPCTTCRWSTRKETPLTVQCRSHPEPLLQTFFTLNYPSLHSCVLNLLFPPFLSNSVFTLDIVILVLATSLMCLDSSHGSLWSKPSCVISIHLPSSLPQSLDTLLLESPVGKLSRSVHTRHIS